MPNPTDQDDRVIQAAYLARDIAPDIDVVLITHYPDVETLDTFRPGDTDLQIALAVNRGVALEMLEAGVEVMVQRADRAAFRRWMSARDDTPENRRTWIDRSRLLRGPAALEVLGLKTSASPPRQTFGQNTRTYRGSPAGGVWRRGERGVRCPGSGAHGRWANRRAGPGNPQTRGARRR